MAFFNNPLGLALSTIPGVGYFGAALATHDITPGFNAPSVGKSAPKKSGSGGPAPLPSHLNTLPLVQTGSSGGSSAASAAAAKQAQQQADEQAYWSDQIANAQQQLGRLPTQQRIGQNNIESAFNASYDKLVGQKNQTQRDYNTNKQNTIQDNITAKSGIDANVRNTNTNIQRLLGARGAGNSSAALVLAPYAAALQGNQQRAQVQTAFGRNIQGLDTAWGDYQNDWNTSVGDLKSQRQNKLNSLIAGIDQTRSKLLQAQSDAAVKKSQAGGASYVQARAARAPYSARINALLSQIDALGAAPTFNPQAVAYKAPTLAQYTYDRQAAPTTDSQVDPTQAQNVGAYWTLLGQQDKKNQLAGATLA